MSASSSFNRLEPFYRLLRRLGLLSDTDLTAVLTAVRRVDPFGRKSSRADDKNGSFGSYFLLPKFFNDRGQ